MFGSNAVSSENLVPTPARTFNNDFTPFLEQYFDYDSYPPAQIREIMAQKSGMTARQIEVWFQNHRRVAKRSGRPVTLRNASSDQVLGFIFVDEARTRKSSEQKMKEIEQDLREKTTPEDLKHKSLGAPRYTRSLFAHDVLNPLTTAPYTFPAVFRPPPDFQQFQHRESDSRPRFPPPKWMRRISTGTSEEQLRKEAEAEAWGHDGTTFSETQEVEMPARFGLMSLRNAEADKKKGPLTPPAATSAFYLPLPSAPHPALLPPKPIRQITQPAQSEHEPQSQSLSQSRSSTTDGSRTLSRKSREKIFRFKNMTGQPKRPKFLSHSSTSSRDPSGNVLRFKNFAGPPRPYIPYAFPTPYPPQYKVSRESRSLLPSVSKSRRSVNTSASANAGTAGPSSSQRVELEWTEVIGVPDKDFAETPGNDEAEEVVDGEDGDTDGKGLEERDSPSASEASHRLGADSDNNSRSRETSTSGTEEVVDEEDRDDDTGTKESELRKKRPASELESESDGGARTTSRRVQNKKLRLEALLS
ncbi:hypothetical protein D9758_005170 [Tetrapyrgos nigripes]|uniref:Homeobox domain-containing protein n=1 Tax=Tetrapyrgos nigripes TaxID=182062 RepID=A0A8H5GWT1_9AGAR|nr:hypothetical protein D9758_005170 [Tetrapyrgos nigripes]